MNKSFAETLRSLRIEKNLSQQQLAEKLFVDRSSIASWETGRRVPDAVLITRLSACLGVDASYLLGALEQPGEPPQVILVDDERILLAGTLPLLEQLLPGAAVTGFSRPSDALDFARQHRVALAFLDIEMGTHSGLDLCRDLQDINPRTNVIFLTAFSEYSLRAWDTGACGFLEKPLTAEAVQKMLGRLRYPIGGLQND